jgi:2-phospho-L-lactate guanylyltransferase
MVIIIPAKPFDHAKTRLADVLSPSQRASLSRRLFIRTIRLANQVSQVVVISRSQAVRQLAKQLGAWALVESENSLNAALRQGINWVLLKGFDSALILPIDLPLLTVTDIKEMVTLASTSPAIVIAPCRHQEGTNALLLSPPNIIDVAFGPDSFARHMHAARLVGKQPVIYESPTIAIDLDTPEDFQALPQR